MGEERYKSLLIINESSDAWVTLYLYPSWDFLCWLSFESKIIKPNEKFLHRSSKVFKFELVAKFKDGRAKQILLESKEWVEDKVLKITNSPNLIEEKLEDFPAEKTICLRKAQRDKELESTTGRRNLYEILGLNIDLVRKMPKEDQIKAIKKGFQIEIQRWHPDKNFGDDENAKEIIMAYEILRDEGKRARYHNEADYDKGWLSLKRYKAIFNPECFTEEQKKSYRHRMFTFAVSLGITVVGTGVTFGIAGLAAPVSVAVGGVFGGGSLGAGLQSLQHTVSRKSVVDEFDNKQWLKKAGIGFVGGAATAGAAVGITAAVAGLGGAAMESASLTIGQYVGIGAASGAVGGAATSLTTDAADGENVTWKQALAHAAVGAAVGAASGAAGGAVTKSVVGFETSTASANLRGEIGEQVAILTGARRLGRILFQRIPRVLTENGMETFMGSVAQFTEERLDDSVENRHPGEHVVKGVKNVAMRLVQESVSSVASHAFNEIQVRKRVKSKHSQQLITPLVDDDTSVVGPRMDGENDNITRERIRCELSEVNNEHRVNWRHHSKYSFSYQPLVSEEPSLEEGATLNTIFEEDGVHHQSGDETVWHSTIVDRDDDVSVQSNVCVEQEDCKVKYISEGYWASKMIVSYFLKEKKITQEVCGSMKSVTVPGNSTQLEVKFQVSRPFWGDIKKYDRFKRCWAKPDQPHVFKYDIPPPYRTFTISGGLWYEAVMRVSNEYHDETKEM